MAPLDVFSPLVYRSHISTGISSNLRFAVSHVFGSREQSDFVNCACTGDADGLSYLDQLAQRIAARSRGNEAY
eukprot:6204320-Pleurochrysis_carterae.AAC.1